MNISRGKLGKYANKYARKESEAAGGGSVHGDSESVTAGADADAGGGGWGIEADTPSQVEAADQTPAEQTW